MADARRRGSSPFNRAILKYGLENIEWDVLYLDVPKDMLDIAEICAIYTFEPEYNIHPGGRSSKGRKWSQEERNRFSKEHHRCWKGRKHTRETRAKMSLVQRGLPGRSFSRKERLLRSEKYSGEGNPMYGKNHTDKTREKMSQIAKEKFRTGERTPNYKLSEKERDLIVTMRRQGYSGPYLARKFGVAQQTVYNIEKKYEENQ